MAAINATINTFINKAQTKMMALSKDIIGNYDYEGWEEDNIDEKILMRYELSEFIRLLHYGNNNLTEKETYELIDFFTVWAELSKVSTTNFINYTMPVEGDTVLPSGTYATTTALNNEILARQQADTTTNSNLSDLSDRVVVLENNQIDPADILPDDFYDNEDTSTVNVWDDDSRLHNHSNKSDLDAITSDLITALQALSAHYASVDEASSLHVTTTERAAWNAKIDQDALDALSSVYAALSHTHEVDEVTGLQVIINQINSDIADMAGTNGVDGKQIEIQSPDNDLIQWRYVGDETWNDIGNFKGDQGDGFVIDVKGPASGRIDSGYDAEDENFSYLEIDTGYLYFRDPVGGSAATSAGWTTGLKFVGDKGWAPVLGVIELSPSKSIFEIVDWVGGNGDKPDLDSGTEEESRWYLGANGITQIPSQATNIKGPQGASGTGPIIGASGSLAERDANDAAGAGFIYLRDDVSPQTIYIKLSDTSGDWSTELPWQGPAGGPGSPGPAGPGTVQTISQASHGLSVKDVITHKEVSGSPGTFSYQKYSDGDPIVGIVTSVISSNSFKIQSLGLATGLSGLIEGAKYYAQTDGTLGTTEGLVLVFLAVSTTSGYILSSGGGGSSGGGTSTGILSGGVATVQGGIGSSALVDLTGGRGVIYDNTDPNNSTIETITWTAKTGLTLNVTSPNVTYWYFDDNTDTIKQTTVVPTPVQRRTRLYVFRTSWNGGNITGLGYEVSPIAHTNNALADFAKGFGVLKNEGLEPQVSGANLNLKITAGRLFDFGSNWGNSFINEHERDFASVFDTSGADRFRNALSSGTDTVDQANIDIGFYQVSGVRTAIPGNNSRVSIFFIWRFPETGNVRVSYSNNYYTNSTEALEALSGVDPFATVPSSYKGNAFLLGAIIVTKAETDLNNATYVITNRFGLFGGGLVAAGGSYLEKSLNLSDLSDIDSANNTLLENNSGSSTHSTEGGNVTVDFDGIRQYALTLSANIGTLTLSNLPASTDYTPCILTLVNSGYAITTWVNRNNPDAIDPDYLLNGTTDVYIMIRPDGSYLLTGKPRE